MFLELPPREAFPDYYQTIKKPISFADIKVSRGASSLSLPRFPPVLFRVSRLLSSMFPGCPLLYSLDEPLPTHGWGATLWHLQSRLMI